MSKKEMKKAIINSANIPNVQKKNIPYVLQLRRQWLMWKLEVNKNGKMTKVPYSINGKKADVTDSSSYCSFKEAIKTLKNGDYSGIGFALTEDDNFVFIDLDGCLDGGESNELARKTMDSCMSYTEISPSGNGLHIILKGYLPSIDDYLRNNQLYKIEMYDSKRFMTVTGNIYENSKKNVKRNQDAIDKICDDYMKRSSDELDYQNVRLAPKLSNEEITKKCRKARNKTKFIALWSGAYGSMYPSPSEADLALCSILAFYTQDPVQIEQIFNQSKLGERGKWKKRPDYRQRTIEKAISNLNQTYQSGLIALSDDREEYFFCEYDMEKNKLIFKPMMFLNWLEDLGVFFIQYEGNIILVKSKNNILDFLSEEELKLFVLEKLRKADHNEEIEVVHNAHGRIFQKWSWTSLRPRKIKFLKDTATISYLFFLNGFFEVSGNERVIHKYSNLVLMDRYIWKEQKMKHVYQEDTEKGDFEKFVRNTASYPEKDKKSKIKQIENEYGYFFRIKNYNAIRTALGEKAHSYKDPSLTKVTVFVDAEIVDQAEGGTGKSLIARSLKNLKNVVIEDGKTFNPRSRFAYQNINVDTQIVLIDDMAEKFDFESLFQKITGSFPIERKNRDKIILSFNNSPKIILTTNYPVIGEGNAFERRQHIVELSNFYRHNSPTDVHGDQRLFGDWSDEEWNRYFTFMIKCIQLYLKKGLKHNVSRSYKEAKLKSECSASFVDWADDFFDKGKCYKKERVYKDFLNTLQLDEKEYSKHKFTGTLRKYCRGRKLELNANKPGNRDRRNGVDYITLSKPGK
jgi:hypothetical protein